MRCDSRASLKEVQVSKTGENKVDIESKIPNLAEGETGAWDKEKTKPEKRTTHQD